MRPLLGWLPAVCLVQIYHHCPYLARFCVTGLLVVPAWAFLPFCFWSRGYSVATWWQVGVAWVCISGRRHYASSVCSLPWLGLVALLSLAVLVKRGHLVSWVCISGRRHFASSVCSLPWLGLVALLSLAVLVKRGYLVAWVCISGRVGACVVLVVVAFISVCVSFCLWPRQYGGTLKWQGWVGRGLHG